MLKGAKISPVGAKQLRAPLNSQEAERRVKDWLAKYLRQGVNVDDAFKLHMLVFAKSPEFLANLAKRNRFAWEVASDLAAGFIEANVTLPEELAEFAVIALQEPGKKPKRRGKDPYANVYRDTCLRSAIYLLAYFGYQPISRNDATAKKHSACDIVAKSYNDLSRDSITADAIKKIWQKLPAKDRAALPWVIRMAAKGQKTQAKIIRQITLGVAETAESTDDFIPVSIFGGK